MPDRTLRYIYESEDRSSAVLNSLASSAGLADNAFDSLIARTQAFDGAAEAAAQQALAFAAAEEELADAGFQNTASIENQILKYDRLLDFFQDDAVATQQLTAAKRQLQAQLSGAAAAQKNFGAASGQTAAFVNNLSFTLNDAQQAQFGFDQFIRATSNNIGVMIGQFQGVIAESKGFRGALRTIRSSLVGPLGISVAFSAVSTAAVLLAGAFKDTADEGDEAANKLEESFAPLIKIVDAVKGSFEFTFEDLQARQGPAQEALNKTTAEIERQEKVVAGLGKAIAFNAGLVSDLREEQQKLADLRQTFADQEKDLAFVNSRLKEEAELRETIAFFEERGLVFNREKTEAEAEAAKEEEKKRKEAEKAAKAAEDEVTALEAATKSRNELLELLKDQNAGELRQLTLLEAEVEALETALEVRRRLIIEEDRQRQIRERFGDQAAPAGLQARGLERIEVRFEEGESPFDRFGLQARGLADGVVEDVERISKTLEDDLFDSVEQFIVLNERLSDSIRGSLAGGIASFGDALGDVASGAADFSAIGRSLLLTLADLAGQIGGQLIAFGVAGLALRRLVANPIGAIIAGTALVALSRVARNRIQASIDNAAGGRSVSPASLGRFDAGGTVDDQAGVFAIPRNTEFENRQATIETLRSQLAAETARANEAEIRAASLVSSPLSTAGDFRNGAGDPLLQQTNRIELSVKLNTDEPVVLPGGTILLSIREGLTQEMELGGSGELVG